VKCFIQGLGRLDQIHLLALRKLQYTRRIQRSVNMAICNAFQCFKLSVEYSKLMATYGCRYLFGGYSCYLRDYTKTFCTTSYVRCTVLLGRPDGSSKRSYGGFFSFFLYFSATSPSSFGRSPSKSGR